MKTLHEMDNSLIFFSALPQLPVLTALTYVSNHLQTGDLRRLHRLIVLSIHHEVWSHVCNGTFENKTVEALNPDLPTVMFYHQGSQRKPGIPGPGLQLRLNFWLCPQPLCYSWPIT